MGDILDDLTLEDVENAYEEKLINSGDKNIVSVVNQNNDLVYIQQLQLFCKFPKRSNTLKFSLVKFGNHERYDIRNWYDNGDKPGKGIVLTYEEIVKLRNSLRNFDFKTKFFKMCGSYTGNKVSAIIYDRICVLNEFSSKGVKWNKEVSVVDWGYGKKIDFRKWAADYSICGKGVAVSFAEAEEIFEIIKTL